MNPAAQTPNSFSGNSICRQWWLGALTAVLLWGCAPLNVQAQTDCSVIGYRVVSRNWDAVLKRGWETRQQCGHLDWPLQVVAIGTTGKYAGRTGLPIDANAAAQALQRKLVQPMLVKAGDVVRLWMQDQAVRIEMTGVADRSAHQGERITVQVTRHDDEAGLNVQHIAGIVSGVSEVEMER
jgi:hypothetical protein